MKRIFHKYTFLWVTLGLFLFTLLGHWIFAWFAYVDFQHDMNRPISFFSYAMQTARDTLENWQSEFLQLIWQVGGLALFLYLGFSHARDSAKRVEEKIDALLRVVAPHEAEKILKKLEQKYPKDPGSDL